MVVLSYSRSSSIVVTHADFHCPGFGPLHTIKRRTVAVAITWQVPVMLDTSIYWLITFSGRSRNRLRAAGANIIKSGNVVHPLTKHTGEVVQLSSVHLPGHVDIRGD